MHLMDQDKNLIIDAIICQLSYIKGDIGHPIKFGSDGAPIRKQLSPDQVELVSKLENLLERLQKRGGSGIDFVAT